MAIQKEIAKHIEYKDLNAGMKLIADVADIDTVRSLIVERPYETIYVSSLSSFRDAHKRYIRSLLKQRNTVNITKTAYQIEKSKQYVTDLLKEIYKEIQEEAKLRRSAAEET